ncbi:uncharacterized protein LOC142168109 [Nicotiana tabacum]|uniref:Uncharacterized protein LOC142168109 n=1 Tax=Nicotiana tabacum TaxID=4097 RepID=A0AC58SIT3_TOBAC
MMWVKGLPFKITFFILKVWRNKLPLDNYFRWFGYLMDSRCWCCANLEEETFHHLIFRSYAAKKVWHYFLSWAGISLEGLSLHQAIVRYWTASVVPRLQTIMQALPSVIVWELWKRRNGNKYGEAVTINSVIFQVSSSLQSLVKIRKPRLQKVPHNWSELLLVMENYTPALKITKVIWEYPTPGWIKVNTDGASRGNPGRSSIDFVLRNEEGDVVYACVKEIHEGTNTEAEAKAVFEALKYCLNHHYMLILHTHSMVIKNVFEGSWTCPWNVVVYVEEIKEMMTRYNIQI